MVVGLKSLQYHWYMRSKLGQNCHPRVESTLVYPKATSLLRISVTKINFRQDWISLLFLHFPAYHKIQDISCSKQSYYVSMCVG